MTDLLSNLQLLGDAEHDDLSVAHDALAEIVRLRMLNADLVEALHHISLCSQNSMSSQLQCGSIARAALAKATGENND